LIEEYGSREGKNTRNVERKEEAENKLVDKQISSGDDLMQVEERNTGAVTWDIYKRYLKFAGGLRWVPIIVSLLLLDQASQGILTSHFDSEILFDTSLV
jgi:ATP-binding cassette subfamily C (CFTR/MRP) protein 1